MAVYTQVTHNAAQAMMDSLGLGRVLKLEGITAGIENTNYFVTTESSKGKGNENGARDSTGAGSAGAGPQSTYVLTIFERLSFTELPYYLHLMRHLAQRSIAVPAPYADAFGEIVHLLCGKPCAVVDKLAGASQMQPSADHCRAVAAMLARMHMAGQSFTMEQENLRGLAWWNKTVPTILPYLNQDQSALLQSELAYQNHISASAAYAALPRGPIHADLFRDNVLFDGDTITGFFDFYFAGNDAWLFDIAVCLNDWCIEPSSGALDSEKVDGFLRSYNAVRPLLGAERQLLPAMLRAGALRFWISRLWDWHLPREASQLKAHDPGHFERILRLRCAAGAEDLVRDGLQPELGGTIHKL